MSKLALTRHPELDALSVSQLLSLSIWISIFLTLKPGHAVFTSHGYIYPSRLHLWFPSPKSRWKMEEGVR